MTIDELVYDLLRNNAAVKDLTADADNATHVRVYPAGEVPANTEFPLVAYHGADNVPSITHDGAQASDEWTIELEIWAESFPACKQLGRAVRAALHGFRGQRGSDFVQGIFLRSQSDDADLPQHGDERSLFAMTQSYSIFYRPDVATATPAT